MWRTDGGGDEGERKPGCRLGGCGNNVAGDGTRDVVEVETLSDSGYSLKVALTAFADGLDVACQRRKESRMILRQLGRCNCH